jgi:hypothetical protein
MVEVVRTLSLASLMVRITNYSKAIALGYMCDDEQGFSHLCVPQNHLVELRWLDFIPRLSDSVRCDQSIFFLISSREYILILNDSLTDKI